ncbi:hypothetical protein [Sphingomonas sp.]|uniref:hypothetical protein n=1 Tax=Sphingomonas sp. TaxID=28214 RepID=UPI00307F145E
MAVDRAQELRQAREIFALAQRDNLTMEEAKRRVVEERWKAAHARLAARRCGTAAPPIEPAPEGERAKPWYEREPFA